MNKQFTILRHEFLVAVKSREFLFTTFGLPLLFLLLGAIGSLPGILSERKAALRLKTGDALAASKLGLVDSSGLFDPDIDKAHISFKVFATPDEARAALENGSIERYIVIPQDYLDTGKVQYTLKEEDASIFNESEGVTQRAIRRWLIENLLKGKTGKTLLDRVLAPADFDTITLKAAGKQGSNSKLQQGVRFGVGYIFAMVLLLSIFITAGRLIQGMAEEKENRIGEVILSSVTPDELMTGKLIGLGGAGLLQLAIWFTLVAIPVFIVLAVLKLLAVDIFSLVPTSMFILTLVYFVLSYLLFGSLMLGFGSLGTNYRESQQMAAMWSMFAAIPMMLMGLIMTDPWSPLAVTMTFIPFTAAITTIMRMAFTTAPVPAWQIAGSVVSLLLGVWLSVKLSARIYRVGILLYGKRPSAAQIWRYLRA